MTVYTVTPGLGTAVGKTTGPYQVEQCEQQEFMVLLFNMKQSRPVGARLQALVV